MGKPDSKNPKKDKFFVKKTSKNMLTKPSSSSSGGFFVTSSENKKEDKKIKQPAKVKKGLGNKKPFDKKKWRFQKYSKKYKLEQWENKRKKAVLQEYYKQIKDDEPKFDVQKIYEKYEDEEENENNLNKDIQACNDGAQNVPDGRSGPPKNKASKKAREELERIKEENKKRKEEIVRQKAERAEAKKQYKARKLENFKKLSKKTKKGQPIMKYRMEMLLERIQKSLT